MVISKSFLERRWSRPSSSAFGLPNMWYQSKLGRPLRRRQQYDFIQRQLRREKEAQFWNLHKANHTGLQGDFNEDKLRIMQNKFLENYFDSLEKGDTSVGMKTDGMLSVHNDLIEIKEWDTFRSKFDRVVKWFYEKYLEKPLPGPIPPKINGVTIHLMDLYKLVESFRGYLSVYFVREFGKIGEILDWSYRLKEVRKCYINFLDVFTSYYKTARVPKQEHNTVLSMPTETVEKGKEYTCPAFHQCDFGDNQAPNKEAASTKGKEKIEHFGIILEDARRDEDSHQIQPISPNIKRSQTKDKDLQGMIKRSINSDTNSSSSISIQDVFSGSDSSGTPTILLPTLRSQLANVDTYSFSASDKLPWVRRMFSVRTNNLKERQRSVSFNNVASCVIFVTEHTEESFSSSDNLNREWAVRPDGSNSDAIPEEATASTIFPSALHILCNSRELANVCEDWGYLAKWKQHMMTTSVGYNTLHNWTTVPPEALQLCAWVKGQMEGDVAHAVTMDLDNQTKSSSSWGFMTCSRNLRSMFSKTRLEQDFCRQMREFYTCMQEEGQFFVQNFNMHGMGKTVNELHAMLKLHEETLPKKDANPALHAIRAGRVQKNQKNKPHKAGKGGQGKGKNKMGYAHNNVPFSPKPKTPPPLRRINPARTHFASTNVGLRGSKKLKPGALSLYVGDGHRAAVEAIGTYHLELPSGLVIVLNNCHYAPSITRGVISVSRLFDDGFINRFDDNNVILVSKNNLVYFMVVPRDGIFEIDVLFYTKR
ncbi:zinc finger, CCHC-type containing protein [Tanacetum coccineum]